MAIIGIDLGTTNSLVSVWQDGHITLIPNSFGEYLTPSVVSFGDAGEIFVGKVAKERLITNPSDTFAEFKRNMGTDYQYMGGILFCGRSVFFCTSETERRCRKLFGRRGNGSGNQRAGIFQ